MTRTLLGLTLTLTLAAILSTATASACSIDPSPNPLYPLEGAEGVPTDSLLWFTHHGDAAETVATLTDADGQEIEVEIAPVLGGWDATIYAATPSIPLLSGVAYTFEVSIGELFGEPRSWTFTTGDGPGQSAQQPTIEDLEYFFVSHPNAELELGCGVSADATMTIFGKPVTDSPFALYKLEVELEDRTITPGWVWSSPRPVAFSLQETDMPVCFTITAVDAFGRESEPKRTCQPDKCVRTADADAVFEYYTYERWDGVSACGTTGDIFQDGDDEDSGCTVATMGSSSEGGALGAFGLLVALGIVVRRRRQRLMKQPCSDSASAV